MANLVPTEPTLDMVEGLLNALYPQQQREHKDALLRRVRATIGTTNEPVVVCEVRAVLAVLNGVRPSDIGFGYRGNRAARS